MPFRLILSLLLATLLPAQERAAGLAPEKEAAIGDAMARDFRDRYGAVELPRARVYLERLVTEAAGALSGSTSCCLVEMVRGYAGAPPWPQALPGGHIFVPLPSLLNASDEEELATRLAHAVAHVVQGDWAVREGRANDSPVILHGTWCGEPATVPIRFREQYGAREQRADEAAARVVVLLTLGTSEFEALRREIARPDPPPPVPSLFR